MNGWNDKGEPHGYWVSYYVKCNKCIKNGSNILYKGNFINGQMIGYWEWYNSGGKLDFKEFYL